MLRVGIFVVMGVLIFSGCSSPPSSPSFEADRMVLGLEPQALRWREHGNFPDTYSKPALAIGPNNQTIIAYTTSQLTISVKAYQGNGQWLDLSEPIQGSFPALAYRDDLPLHLCYVKEGGPFVRYFDGDMWYELGGSIELETNTDSRRGNPQYCNLVLNSQGIPYVSWTTHYGSKAEFSHVARWNSARNRWQSLGYVGERASQTVLDIDHRDRPIVMAHKPGGSYGGNDTEWVFRYERGNWQQLGKSFENVRLSVQDTLYESLLSIATYENEIYAIYSYGWMPATLYLMRWDEATTTWQRLGEPLGVDGLVDSMDFGLHGTPVVTYETVQGTFPADYKLFVKRYNFNTARWQQVGGRIQQARAIELHALLRLDGQGRPNVIHNLHLYDEHYQQQPSTTKVVRLNQSIRRDE